MSNTNTNTNNSNTLIKFLIGYGLFELAHYCYLVYLLNKTNVKTKLIIEPENIIETIGITSYADLMKTNNLINKINKINKINLINKKSSYNTLIKKTLNAKSELEPYNLIDFFDNLYTFVKTNYCVKTDTSNFKLFYPYPFILRLGYTFEFLFDLSKYSWMGFDIKYTSDSIILFYNNPNSNKLILIHPGMLGNINNFINLICQTKDKYSILVSVFRSTVTTFYWNNSSILTHVTNIIDILKNFKTIDIVAHSYGAYIIEYMFNAYPYIQEKINKEILIQPGNILSMGLIFLAGNKYSLYNYYNIINSYSKFKFYNFGLAITIKSFGGCTTISTIKSLDGIRFNPRKFKGYLIVSINDPLISYINTHPSFHEINHIFKDYKIHINEYFHGYDPDNTDVVCKFLSE